MTRVLQKPSRTHSHFQDVTHMKVIRTPASLGNSTPIGSESDARDARPALFSSDGACLKIFSSRDCKHATKLLNKR